MRFGLAEGVASEDEIRGGNRDRGNTGFFQSGGKEAHAESFSEGSEAIGEFRGGNDTADPRHFVEKIATKKLQTATDAVVGLLNKLKILKHVEVQMNYAFGFIARLGKPSFSESSRDGEKMIGDTLHRRDHHNRIGVFDSRTDQTGGVQQALGSKQRAAAELQGDNILLGASRAVTRGYDREVSG
jgi:hypothetical protein